METLTIKARKLSDLENEWLEKILDACAPGSQTHTVPVTREHWDGSGEYTAHDWPVLAIIVWRDERDEIQCGRVRWGHRNSMPGQRDRWSASPFPGAWSDVPKDRILIVRHPDTM